MIHTITDIGQLTANEKRTLSAYVKKGYLSKGKGGGYPTAKTVYAYPGFGFAADRKSQIDELMQYA